MQFFQKFRPVSVLLILIVVLAAVPVSSAAAQTGTGTATVDTGALRVHTGPSPGFPSVATIYQGERVTLLGRSSDTSYIFVRTGNNVEGWISSFYVIPGVALYNLPVLAEAEPWGLITGTVSLRTGPAITFERIIVLGRSDALGLLGRNADSSWLYVRHPDGNGWVSSAYVTAGTAFRHLPIVGTAGVPAATGGSTFLQPGQAIPAVSTDFQRVGERPWNTSATITFLDEGETGLYVLGQNADGSYYYILFREDSLGWVRSATVRLEVAGTPPIIDHEQALVGENLPAATIDNLGLPVATPTQAPVVTPIPTTPTTPQSLGSGIPAVSTLFQPARTHPHNESSVVTFIDEGETGLQVLGRTEDSQWLYVLFRDDSLAWFEAAHIAMQAAVTPPVVNPDVVITGENLPASAIDNLSQGTGGTVIPGTGASTEPRPTQVFGTATVTAGRLNVRAKPNGSAGILSQLDNGAQLNLLARDSGGFFVFVGLPNGGFGWVDSDFVRASINIFDLPTSKYSVPTDAVGIAQISTPALSVRTGPNTAYDRIGIVRERQIVNMLARAADSSWVVIRTLDGTLQGWVATGEIIPYISYRQLPITTAPPNDAVGTATVVVPALNLRSGPTVNSTALGVVYEGARLEILGRTADSVWLKLRTTQGTVGWLSNGNVQPDVPLSSIPIVQ